MNAEQQLKNRAILATLTGPLQRTTLLRFLKGKEGEHYENALANVSRVWDAMPKTYETEGQGRAAVAHLHFFVGGCDWWIVEKDSDTDGVGQIQATGIADLGLGCREMGYISIPEILDCGAELDLYYQPATVGEIMGRSVA
jgi:hypothetical protein